jgi:hypothetical protein
MAFPIRDRTNEITTAGNDPARQVNACRVLVYRRTGAILSVDHGSVKFLSLEARKPGFKTIECGWRLFGDGTALLPVS